MEGEKIALINNYRKCGLEYHLDCIKYCQTKLGVLFITNMTICMQIYSQINSVLVVLCADQSHSLFNHLNIDTLSLGSLPWFSTNDSRMAAYLVAQAIGTGPWPSWTQKNEGRREKHWYPLLRYYSCSYGLTTMSWQWGVPQGMQYPSVSRDIQCNPRLATWSRSNWVQAQ